MRNEIICDKCKLIISKFEIKTHIITKDEKGIDVQESYFQCPTCGKSTQYSYRTESCAY